MTIRNQVKCLLHLLSLGGGYALTFAVMASTSLATTTYTVTTVANDVDNPTPLASATVEVREDGSDEVRHVAFSEIGTFPEGAVFRKRGEGYLLSSDGLQSLSKGELRIEEGGFVIDANGQLGASDTTVVVSNGASLVLACSNFRQLLIRNAFRLCGAGYEGKGAIRSRCSASQQDYCFYNCRWQLDGDAVYVTDSTARIDCGGADFCLDLGGHTLTVRKGDAAGTLGLADFGGIVNAGATGGIIVDGAKLMTRKTVAADGTAANLLRVENGGLLHLDRSWHTLPWTMRLTGDVTLWTGGEQPYVFAADQSTDSIVYGPVALDQASVAQTINYAGYGLTYFGPVTGTADYLASGSYLHLHGETDFDGSLTVTRDGDEPGGVAFWKPESVPQRAPLSVVDADMAFVSDFSTYGLPAVTNTVTAGRVQSVRGGTNVTAASFVKLGAGRLDIHSPLQVTGAFELAEGSVKFARYGGAGLVGGRVTLVNSSQPVVAVDGTWYADAQKYAMHNWGDDKVSELPAYTLELGVGAGTYLSHRISATESADETVVVCYAGYLWNRSATNETWTVAGAFGTNMSFWRYWNQIKFTKWNELKTAQVVVGPGANYFQITAYGPTYRTLTREGAYTGPAGGNDSNYGGWNWKTSDGVPAGIRVDRLGRQSKDWADYEPFEDPGDGSFLTYEKDGSNTKRADYRFAAFVAADGTSVDLFGNPLTVGTLTGAPAVTNSNAYHADVVTVTDAWTLPAASIVAGRRLSVVGDLAFAEGATLTVAGPKAFRGHAGEYVIAEVTGSFKGLPVLNIDSDAATRMKLRLSEDGKRLLLSYASPGVAIIFR